MLFIFYVNKESWDLIHTLRSIEILNGHCLIVLELLIIEKIEKLKKNNMV